MVVVGEIFTKTKTFSIMEQFDINWLLSQFPPNNNLFTSRQVARITSRLSFRNFQTLATIILLPIGSHFSRLVMKRHGDGIKHQFTMRCPIAFLHQFATIHRTIWRHKIEVVWCTDKLHSPFHSTRFTSGLAVPPLCCALMTSFLPLERWRVTVGKSGVPRA